MPRSADTGAPATDAPEWRTRPERGNALAIRSIAWIARTLGRRTARALLYPVCGYFLLSSAKVRAASRTYLGKVLGRDPGIADLFRHCHTFAATVLDRVFLLAGDFSTLDVRLHGLDAVQAAMAQGQGVILLGAHLGSFEIIRAAAREKCGPAVSMVMYEENARKVNAVLHAINPELAQRVIELGKPGSMLKVRDALQRGEFVGILADRVIAGEGEAVCSFLGEPARFPTGPLRMASMLKCPVMLMVGLYRGGNRYEVHFESLSGIGAGSGGATAEANLAAYVARIEHYCRIAPYNWFNFFDFWEQ